MSLGLTVNKAKNGLLLAYIASNIPNIHLRKLLKIIYLLDEHFMKMRGFPLTWFDYYAWSKGPVAPEVYEIKNGAFADYVLSHNSMENKCIVNAVIPQSNILKEMKSAFSDNEIAEMGRIIETYGEYSADELSGLTHLENSVWSKVVNDHNIVFNEYQRTSDCLIDLRLLFEAGDWRIKTYEDTLFLYELQAKLDANRNPDHRIQLRVSLPSEIEKDAIPVYHPVIP